MTESDAQCLIDFVPGSQRGLWLRVSGFIHEFGGNILDSDHHTDQETGELSHEDRL